MTWPPKISIITPSYNQGQYLEQTIMSVLGQGYPNLEYIIIDGGSTDNSVKIIETYKNRLAYWHSRRDKGQAHGINLGIEKATGDIIAYLNSDDKLLEGSLWKMAYLSREYPDCDLFCGANYMMFETGGVAYECSRPWLPGKLLGALQDATFWRASVHKKTGLFDESFQFAMCNDFFTRALFHHRTLFLSEPISVIRKHPLCKTITMGDVSRSDLARLSEVYKGYSPPADWRVKAWIIRLLAGSAGWLARHYWGILFWRMKMEPLKNSHTETSETQR